MKFKIYKIYGILLNILGMSFTGSLDFIFQGPFPDRFLPSFYGYSNVWNRWLKGCIWEMANGTSCVTSTKSLLLMPKFWFRVTLVLNGGLFISNLNWLLVLTDSGPRTCFSSETAHGVEHMMIVSLWHYFHRFEPVTFHTRVQRSTDWASTSLFSVLLIDLIPLFTCTCYQLLIFTMIVQLTPNIFFYFLQILLVNGHQKVKRNQR